MKKCVRCREIKSNSDFGKDKSQPDGLRIYCKLCQNKINRGRYWKNRSYELMRSKKYRESHKADIRKKGKIWREELRLEVFTHYGGNPPKCACCGETQILFLSIDHIGGAGNKHRTMIKRYGGWGFYAWLRTNNFPDGYQVLCFNCNMGRARNAGICPHVKIQKERGLVGKTKRKKT